MPKHHLIGYNLNDMPGWSIPWNSPCKSSRILLRAFIIAKVPCGWPVKWGNSWDIPYPDGRMVPSGQSTLSNMTYKDWVDFARKHLKST
jgi:hypothetical protein